MNNQDKKDFAATMILAAEVYNKTLSPELLTIYFDLLADFHVDQVSDAISKHLVDPEQGSFFPKPADIVRNMNQKKDEGAKFRPYIHHKTERTPPPPGLIDSWRKLL